MINMKDRYTYVGSVTTPPCATKVYWNVQTTIYPIKQRHVDQFKAQLARGHAGHPQTPKLEVTGNWRVIQAETPEHNPIIIRSSGFPVGMLVVIIILALIVFGLLIVVIKMKKQLEGAAAPAAAEMTTTKVDAEKANGE